MTGTMITASTDGVTTVPVGRATRRHRRGRPGRERVVAGANHRWRCYCRLMLLALASLGW